GQGPSHGRQGRRHLQDVFHQFHYRPQSLLRRQIPRTRAGRTHSLHRQVRRSEPARRDADDDHFEEGVVRNGVDRRARGFARCHPARGLLSRLARISHTLGEARRGRDSRLVRRFGAQEFPMIVEYIRYRLPSERCVEFEQAYGLAAESLRASPHCLAYELTRCTDDATCYVLRIEWDSAEGHLQGFRASPEFRTFL